MVDLLGVSALPATGSGLTHLRPAVPADPLSNDRLAFYTDPNGAVRLGKLALAAKQLAVINGVGAHEFDTDSSSMLGFSTAIPGFRIVRIDLLFSDFRKAARFNFRRDCPAAKRA